MPEQFCTQCGKTKELNADNFYRNRSRPSGYDHQMCKLCRRVYTKNRHKIRTANPFVNDPVVCEPEKFTEFDKLAHDHKYKEIRSKLISMDRPIEVAIPLGE